MMRYTTNVADKGAAADSDPKARAMPETRPDEAATPAQTPLCDDILRGADEIARFVFGDAKHRRKVYYLTGDAKHGLPYFKLGSVICARKSTLLAWIADQENTR